MHLFMMYIMPLCENLEMNTCRLLVDVFELIVIVNVTR